MNMKKSETFQVFSSKQLMSCQDLLMQTSPDKWDVTSRESPHLLTSWTHWPKKFSCILQGALVASDGEMFVLAFHNLAVSKDLLCSPEKAGIWHCWAT